MGAEFPQTDVFVIGANFSMIASRWVAVGFDRLEKAEAFKHRYVDRPSSAEFEYKSDRSKSD